MKTKLITTKSLLITLALFTSFSVTIAEDAKAKLCSGCHGQDGKGLSDEFPNLAGQKFLYLKKQLLAFKNGERQNPTMNAMASALSDSDIEDLAHHYSSLGQTKSSSSSKPTSESKLTHASKTEFPKSIYISMKGSGTIERFPVQSIWQGGPNMLYTAITPNGKMLLSSSPSTDTVYLFDTSSGSVLAKVPVGKAPKGVKVAPNGQFAYVSNQESANISVIDLNSLKVSHTINVGKGPHNVRFTKDGRLAYVTLQGGAGIGVVDTKKNSMTSIIPVPGITGPHNLDLSKDEKTAYIRDFVHNVAVLDLTTKKIKKVIKVGSGHGGIDVASNDSLVATAAIGDDFISIINPKTFSVTNIKVGNGPHGIRFSADNQWLYVTVTKDNTVVVIDAKTLKIIKTIIVDKFPFWIAVKGNP